MHESSKRNWGDSVKTVNPKKSHRLFPLSCLVFYRISFPSRWEVFTILRRFRWSTTYCDTGTLFKVIAERLAKTQSTHVLLLSRPCYALGSNSRLRLWGEPSTIELPQSYNTVNCFLFVRIRNFVITSKLAIILICII